MWYEILPPFIIITASLGLPGWGLWWFHKLALGNHYRRSLLDRWDRANYQRDWRVAGSPYTLRGLETLPEPKPKTKKATEQKKPEAGKQKPCS